MVLQGSGSGGYLKFDEGLKVFNLIKFVKKKKMEWISTQGNRHSKVGGVDETSLNAELHGIRFDGNFYTFIYIL